MYNDCLRFCQKLRRVIHRAWEMTGFDRHGYYGMHFFMFSSRTIIHCGVETKTLLFGIGHWAPSKDNTTEHFCSVNSSVPGQSGRLFANSFSDAFLWKLSFVFWLNFHWSLFARVQLSVSLHWFWWRHGTDWATNRSLNQWMLDFYIDSLIYSIFAFHCV